MARSLLVKKNPETPGSLTGNRFRKNTRVCALPPENFFSRKTSACQNTEMRLNRHGIPEKFERFISRLPPRKCMAFYNLCRCCGHRVPASIHKCRQCGSSSNTNQNKKIMSGVFVLGAILLIFVISRIL